MVWGLPRCVWARESTALEQGNQPLSRELLAVLCALSRAGSTPFPKVIRKGAGHTQSWEQASGFPLHVLEHLPPKLMSAYFLLCALTYTSDLTGWCPPLPLSKKRVNLQLQLIIPWNDNVPTYKLFWKSFSLPVWVFRAHVIGQSLPIVRGRRCSKLSKHRFLSVVK